MHISAGDVLCESETCHFIFQLIYNLGSVRLAIHHMQWFMLWMHSLCNLLGVCMLQFLDKAFELMQVPFSKW